MACRLYEAEPLVKFYSLYRPESAAIVKERVKSFMNKHGCSFNTIVDVGCGPGQSLRAWTDTFQRCVGLDISEEQIKQGSKTFTQEKIENIEFRVSAAESLPQDLENCDLVTIATAWHWVDSDAFYKQADRVLKKPGVLAVYGYSIPYFPDNEEATSVIENFYHVDLKDCMHPNMDHCYDRYSNVHPAYKLSERHDFDYEWCISLSHFIGTLESEDAYWFYQEKYPDSTLLADVKTALKAALCIEDDDAVVKTKWPIFMVLSLKT